MIPIEEKELSVEELREIWVRRAHALAQPPPDEPEGKTINLLVFSLNESHYAVEVIYVKEITYLKRLTPVPRTPNFIVGVFNNHGRVASVTDLHALWGLPPTQLLPASQIIVVTADEGRQDQDMELALLVDEVTDIVTVFEDDLVPGLTIQQDSFAKFVRGIALKTVTVLDLKALLSNDQLMIHEEIS